MTPKYTFPVVKPTCLYIAYLHILYLISNNHDCESKLSDKIYRVEANCADQQGRPVYNWKTTQ